MAAALPGGDPLAEALAAGETPSPEMVAAAGPEGSISPAVGLACLVAIAVGLAAAAWMSQHTTLASHEAVERSADFLVDRARTILADLGYTDTPAAVAYGYDVNVEYLRGIWNTDRSPARWEALRDDRKSPLGFWYRQSPQPMWPASPPGVGIPSSVTRTDPPDATPGMMTLVVDPAGRLTRLTAVPAIAGDAAVAAATDWTPLFQHAGLVIDSFAPAAPQRLPPVFASEQAAWEGTLPGDPDVPIRIEAAAHAARPVHFEIVAPWAPAEPVRTRGVADLAMLAVTLALLCTVAFLSWRNLRLGRADRRGAVRVGALAAGSSFVALALIAQNPGDFVPEGGRGVALWTSLGRGLIACAYYAALEPYARRVWPETLIGWSRLLAGRMRDPLVGREILFGVLGGVFVALISHLRFLVPARLGLLSPIPWAGVFRIEGVAPQFAFPLLGGRYAVSMVVAMFGNALLLALASAALLCILTMLLRSRRRAIIVYLVFAFVGPFGTDYLAGDLVWNFLAVGSAALLLGRFGVLALAAYFATVWLASGTFDFAATSPLAFASYLFSGAVLVLTIYGVATALGGRAAFTSLLLRDGA